MHQALIQAAIEARRGAYAPYSDFSVGAALLGADGEIYTGANVENASYGGTICAERSALVKAVNAGVREFQALAIHGGEQSKPGAAFLQKKAIYAFPCGICRQMLAEFCRPDMPIYVVKSAEDFLEFTFAELLPHSFGPENLAAAFSQDAD